MTASGGFTARGNNARVTISHRSFRHRSKKVFEQLCGVINLRSSGSRELYKSKGVFGLWSRNKASLSMLSSARSAGLLRTAFLMSASINA